METLARNLTYEEWLQMPTVQDGTDEVVNGELRFMPPTRFPHGAVIHRLSMRLSRQLDEDLVEIIESNFGLMIGREPLTCRSPDMGLFWRDKLVLRDGLYCSPADLIVEVLSPSETKRKKLEKLADYARIQVAEAWVISPPKRSVEIYRLSDGKLAFSQNMTDGELRPVRFPGVSVLVSDIWPK